MIFDVVCWCVSEFLIRLCDFTNCNCSLFFFCCCCVPFLVVLSLVVFVLFVVVLLVSSILPTFLLPRIVSVVGWSCRNSRLLPRRLRCLFLTVFLLRRRRRDLIGLKVVKFVVLYVLCCLWVLLNVEVWIV